MKDLKQGKANNEKYKDAVKDIKGDQIDGEASAKKVGFSPDFNDEIIAEIISENDENNLDKLPKLIRKVNLFLQMPDEQFVEVVRDF